MATPNATVRDVDSGPLLESLAERMKGDLQPPPWAAFVKTGAGRERAPTQPDWWFRRSASLLRRLYLHGPLGISRLRTHYGSRRRRGSASARFSPGSGNILRKSLQQMEKQGWVKTLPGRGRELTPKGRALLEGLAQEVAQRPPPAAPAPQVPRSRAEPPRAPAPAPKEGPAPPAPGPAS